LGRPDAALAQRLQELRLRSGLSQQQHARAIGVTAGAVCHYEYAITRIPYERHAAIAQTGWAAGTLKA
jgi:transcriptional regulator with XRE-family HTH domain